MVSASPPPHYHHITITSTTTFLACKASYTGWGLESRSNPGLLGSRCLRSAGLIRGHLSFHVGTFRAVLGQANAPVFMVTSCSCSCSSQCDRSHRTDLCSELALEPQGPPLVCRVCCQGPAAAGLERPLLEPVCRSPSRAGSGAPGTTACPQSCAARGLRQRGWSGPSWSPSAGHLPGRLRLLRGARPSVLLPAPSAVPLWTPRTTARQGPLPAEFSSRESWSGLPSPPPGDLPDPGLEPRSPALQAGSLPLSPWGSAQGFSRRSG